MIRDADDYAKKLLVVASDAADAYLTLGAANYIIGSLPGDKKLFLAFAVIQGDKRVSLQRVEIAAEPVPALTVAVQGSDSQLRDHDRCTSDPVGRYRRSRSCNDRGVFLPTHPNDADGCNDRDRKVHTQHTAEFAAHEHRCDCCQRMQL